MDTPLYSLTGTPRNATGSCVSYIEKYTYIPKGDFFSSALEAWQRRFGYAALYDKSASHFHMVFNALPVYFVCPYRQ